MKNATLVLLFSSVNRQDLTVHEAGYSEAKNTTELRDQFHHDFPGGHELVMRLHRLSGLLKCLSDLGV